MPINIIVAMCNKTRGIGYLNKLPWNIKDDLKYFQKLTIGNNKNAVLMGKNTWISLPKKPLTKRKNIILSSTLQPITTINYNQIKKNNVSIFNNYDNLLFHLEKQHFDDIWIIGGEKIYELFLNKGLVDNIYITSIEAEKYIKFDTFFPTLPDNYKLKYKSNIHTEADIYGPTMINYKYCYLNYHYSIF